jgi:hypothetical protein
MKTPILLLLASLASITASLQARSIDLVTTPTSDGEIVGRSSLEDDADLVTDLGMGAKTGWFYGKLYVANFEFALPPDEKAPALQEARILLSSNTTNPDGQPTPSPVTVEVYGYTDDHADGFIDDKDWKGGELLGLAVAREDEITPQGKLPAIDVTEFVRKALSEGKKIAGFRLQTKDEDSGSKESGLTIRTAEFGQEYAGNEPKLVLVFQD